MRQIIYAKMAENKKGFLLYADLLETFDYLTMEQRGQVITWILEYVNDKNPEPLAGLLAAVCEPIKQQLKRDLTKWEGIRQKRSDAGKKSAEARANKKKQQATNSTSVKSVEQTPTKSTVNVNDNVNVSVNVNDSVINKEYSKAVFDCFNDCLNHFPEHLHPSTQKQKNAWLDTIEKLNRIEKLPFGVIVEITEKTRQSDFWAKNFLSLTKLRKTNKDGIKYIVVFNEHIKNQTNGTGTKLTRAEEIRQHNAKVAAEILGDKRNG